MQGEHFDDVLHRVLANVEQDFISEPVMAFVSAFFLFNIAIMLAEMLLDAGQSKPRRWWDTAGNLAILAGQTLINSTILGVAAVIFLAPFTLLQWYEIPRTLWSWVLAVLIADFLYYWMHRVEHKVRILWAFHSVHHSSQDYNLSVPGRLSWVQDFQEWIFLIPMVLMGFDLFQTLIAFVLVSQYQNWIHTKRIGRLGWLEYLFNTPSAHRVHHGTARHHLDKNFGGILIIWDRMFGTFQTEDQPVIYGLTDNIHSNNPVWINLVEYWRMAQDCCSARGWKNKLAVLFAPPGRRPEVLTIADSKLTDSSI
ncbi:sterol desaturase family protein [Bowmanella denitrificans]|uniref:Sterol desaturase family protein n=1 Tax=Bowmanella denitrificans TaxID=366582 RepID=A0ABN0WZN5_9ALTE